MKFLLFLSLFLNVSCLSAVMTSDQALERLVQGNRRFMEDKSTCLNRNDIRRASLTANQNPFAVILGCSDSRVAPELVFDQGIGDLFIVRVAGNVAGISELNSLEFAVKHVNASLILVLGHEGCAAVKAVYMDDDADIPDIARLIEPAVRSAGPDKPLEASVRANIRLVVERIKNAEIIKDVLKERNIKVVGGYYHLETGRVEILEE